MEVPAPIQSIATLGSSIQGSLADLSGYLPSQGLGLLLIALVVLPLVNIFISPFLRLAAALTHGAATIGGALIMCVTQWCVLVIHCVTALAVGFRSTRSRRRDILSR